MMPTKEDLIALRKLMAESELRPKVIVVQNGFNVLDGEEYRFVELDSEEGRELAMATDGLFGNGVRPIVQKPDA